MNIFHALGGALMLWFIPAIIAGIASALIYSDKQNSLDAIRLALWSFAVGTLGVFLFNL